MTKITLYSAIMLAIVYYTVKFVSPTSPFVALFILFIVSLTVVMGPILSKDGYHINLIKK